MANEDMIENIDGEGEEIEKDQYLVFTVKSQEFGLQAMRVQEISRVLDIAEVPNAPPYIEGILNLRGRLASVINFRKKFGIEPKAHDEETRTIIVERAGFPIGIIVDSVQEVIKISEEMVQVLPESTTGSETEEYISGVGMLDTRLIVLLDMDKILSKTELGELDAISQITDKVKSPQAKEEKTPKKARKKAGKAGPIQD